MATQSYEVNQHRIETILAWIKSEEISIPEIQRPFVWSSSKVRDFIDSLYRGYPVGYIIAWQNPSVRAKDGTLSKGKKILIDGQQRITALTAAVLDQHIINEKYKKVKIKIAFNPLEERFEVRNPAISKDKLWFEDISIVINESILKVLREYMKENPEVDEEQVEKAVTALANIKQRQIGFMLLAEELDIETVTEIFIRVNSKGVILNQADFAMSKIASDVENNGAELRKAIDHFCHLAIDPNFYEYIATNDNEFQKTEFFEKLKWLKNENDDLYDPDYTDLIRVAFTSQFNRGRLSELVSLLSGRNFETKTYETEIVRQSFSTLKKGVLNFINETNFKRFLMIINSAGFISNKQIRSKNAINFAYIIYLRLKELDIPKNQIESFVRRWFAYSILTARYTGPTETKFESDIKEITDDSYEEVLKGRELGELSDAFWDISLPQKLKTSAVSSSFFQIFIAAQINEGDKGFLSKDISIRNLVEHHGDVHHLFPRGYLKKQNLKKTEYNQIANYVYMQSEINIGISNRPPKEYLTDDFLNKVSNLSNADYSLDSNLEMNCIPREIKDMDISQYDEFLEVRRKLMAKKIKDYYFKL